MECLTPMSKRNIKISHRSKDAEGHPHHTDTGGPKVETGDAYRSVLQDAGDVRNHEVRSLPSPQGGDHWGSQSQPTPYTSNGGPIYGC